ncbi:MAG: hypothetical protein AAFP19_25185 [Bacteroidota bacterium]
MHPATLSTILQDHHIHPQTGFLPSEAPLLQLPHPYYQAWEALARELPDRIQQKAHRAIIDQWPVLEIGHLETAAERERAMLLLSFFAHAYIHSSPGVKVLPRAIALPWVALSEQMDRLPILSHPSGVLNNWRKLDPEGEFHPKNLATLLQFNHASDEAWFYLITAQIEAIGARAILPLLTCRQHVESREYDAAIPLLQKGEAILKEMTLALNSLYDHCDPAIFYHEIRPFLASFEAVTYEGVQPAQHSYHGGSAAQSSLLQFFDAIFGIRYEGTTAAYLLEMRKHMPRPHADWLRWVEQGTSLQSADYGPYQEAYEAAVAALIEFRNAHLKVVAIYIMKPAAKTEKEAKGTGGTSPLIFLKDIRNKNQEQIK